MGQSPSGEANRFAGLITAFTSARHLSLSCASSIQSIPLHPTSWRSILIKSTVSVQFRGSVCECFVAKICFHSEELSAPRPTPNLEDRPLSAVRDCLFNIFAATLNIGGRSSIRNLRTRHSVVTGTHLSHGRRKCKIQLKCRDSYVKAVPMY
jgi:hypothetical protein